MKRLKHVFVTPIASQSIAAAGAVTSSPWEDARGFQQLIVAVTTDASHAWKLDVLWSVDAATTNTAQNVFTGTSASTNFAFKIPSAAKWVEFTLTNQAVGAHTMKVDIIKRSR